MESNTSIILDQSSLGLTGFLNFSWDIFDGFAKNKINQSTALYVSKLLFSSFPVLIEVRNLQKHEFDVFLHMF